MKRMHIHISVDDLQTAISFYSAMLGAKPTVSRPDYAKWAIDNPKVNLAISQQAGNRAGLDHLGIQAETAAELDELYARLGDASYAMHTQKGARCCYAESDKHWAVDPAGIAWEMFHTLGAVTVYGNDRARTLRDSVG
jgi:catechol 2,3-dioxygenase-like lactoylglutathione lyase family enzyme